MKLERLLKVLVLLAPSLLFGMAHHSSAAAENSDSTVIERLAGSDSDAADVASMGLFFGGLTSVDDLILASADERTFGGRFFHYPHQSLLLKTRPTVGLTCLYLIESIRRQNLFFGQDALLVSAHDPEYGRMAHDPERSKLAVRAYSEWWERVRSAQGEERLRLFYSNDPLEGTGIRWREPLGAHWMLKGYGKHGHSPESREVKEEGRKPNN